MGPKVDACRLELADIQYPQNSALSFLPLLVIPGLVPGIRDRDGFRRRLGAAVRILRHGVHRFPGQARE
jgi:hypothetical protein